MENKPDKPKPPDILYQYRPPELWALENLSQRVLYFNSPVNFNDPYDCNVLPSLKGLTEEKYAAIKAQYPILSELPDTGKSVEKRIRDFDKYTPRLWESMREGLGIACFSARRDNLLMWSHYAGRGEGFCLAFDTQDKLFYDDDCVEVNYPNNPPAPGADIFLTDNVNPLLPLLTSKSSDWAYEKEWRVFRGIKGDDNRRKVKYALDTIKAIYFGTEATASTVKVVRAIVKEEYRNVNVEFHKGRRSKTEYEVEFDPIR